MSSRTVAAGGFVFCHREGHPEEFKVFQVVEHKGCEGCYYRAFFGRCKKPKGLFGACKAKNRSDGKDVVFKKVNQVRMIKSAQ